MPRIINAEPQTGPDTFILRRGNGRHGVIHRKGPDGLWHTSASPVTSVASSWDQLATPAAHEDQVIIELLAVPAAEVAAAQ